MSADLGPESSGSRTVGLPRSVIVTIGALIALAVLAVAVVTIRPSGAPVYPPDSPEAAFQSYLIAWEADDLETAYGYFSTTVRATVSLTEYRRMAADFAWQRDQERRVVLDGVNRSAERATLRLRIEEFSDDGLGGNRYSSDREIRLVLEAGAWKIDEPLAGVDSTGYHAN